MDNTNRVKRNITKLYFYWFFHALILAYVIERLYWAERGMTVQYVVYVEIIYAIVIAILEVPSGYLSDRWSRKWMMVLGGVFTCFEFLILIFAKNFWHFVFAILFAAMQGAISSGTSNALVYDSLKMIGAQEQFEKVIGRIRFFKYIAAMFAALLGSLIAASYGLSTNYWVSFGSVVIALIIALTLVEPSLRATEKQEASDTSYVTLAYRFLRDHRSLQFVLVYGIIIGATLTYLHEFWQLYLEWLGIPVILFGIVSATNMFTSSISGLIAYRIKERFSFRTILLIIMFMYTSGLVIMSVVHHPIGLFFMWLSFVSAGVMEPLVTGYLHHRSPSNYRATVESFYSLALRVTVAMVGLFFGVIADHYGINGAFLALGLLSFVYCCYFCLKRRNLIEEN